MKIERITLMFNSKGPDLAWLHTDLPCPFVPAFLPKQPNADLKLEMSAETGERYIEEHFPGVPVEIIDRR
jgi:hypothetical protein